MTDPQPSPNFMIVSGNGRNSGKTSFITQIISNNSTHRPLTAIKISPHLHKGTSPKGIIIKSENYLLAMEDRYDGGKDSSRMLQAGAEKVYYIEAFDEHLEEAFNSFTHIVKPDGPIICESGGLRNLIIPSLFIMINRNDGRKDKQSYLKRLSMADRVVHFDGIKFSLAPDNIYFNGDRWQIREANGI